jgi:protein-L-isoaspartate(D-aspartate) O-methyltransferase
MSRDSLIEEIAADFAETVQWTGRARMSDAVRQALARVPREEFVPEMERSLAYVNAALPIGHRQTISQPFVVAIMTELLDLKPGQSVLEIGTGSGYQAAVLAALGAKVCSIEVIPALGEQARATLQRLGYTAEVRIGDGNLGWPEKAPFDAIIVTAAARQVPPALVAQLKPGGRMVIPVGEPGGEQVLTVIDKAADGKISRRATLPVAFVPLV